MQADQHEIESNHELVHHLVVKQRLVDGSDSKDGVQLVHSDWRQSLVNLCHTSTYTLIIVITITIHRV
jgi:hypothetical protein